MSASLAAACWDSVAKIGQFHTQKKEGTGDIPISETFWNMKGCSVNLDALTPPREVIPCPKKNLPDTTNPSSLMNPQESTFAPWYQ